MTESHIPTDRLNYTGELGPVVGRLCTAYGVGEPISFSAIEIGYEDCNVVIEAGDAKYMAKMFAKTRSPEDIERYTGIMQAVVDAGVNHPELVTTESGSMTYTDSGITLVLMRFVEGDTFLDLDRAPDVEERRAVLEQAAMINAIEYDPPYLFDSWAIPNIHAMYDRVKQYIQTDDLPLVEQAMVAYDAIPVDDLPHAFVHGDLTKANVIKAKTGDIFVVDFSVANRYPRIQELAVIAANLQHDPNDPMSLKDRCQVIADEYSDFIPLADEERKYLYPYAIAAAAMEFMGSHQEKYINGNDVGETDYWLKLGREGLKREFA